MSASADLEALTGAEASMRVGEVRMGEDGRGVTSPDWGPGSSSFSEPASS